MDVFLKLRRQRAAKPAPRPTIRSVCSASVMNGSSGNGRIQPTSFFPSSVFSSPWMPKRTGHETWYLAMRISTSERPFQRNLGFAKIAEAIAPIGSASWGFRQASTASWETTAFTSMFRRNTRRAEPFAGLGMAGSGLKKNIFKSTKGSWIAAASVRTFWISVR